MQYKKQTSVHIEINIKLKRSSLMNKKAKRKMAVDGWGGGLGASGAAGLYSKLMKVMLHGRIP